MNQINIIKNKILARYIFQYFIIYQKIVPVFPIKILKVIEFGHTQV